MDIVFYWLRLKKKTVKKYEIWLTFFAIGCKFYPVEGWDDVQNDLHVSLHVCFNIQFAGIVPVFLEFNDPSLTATIWIYISAAPIGSYP